MSITSCIRHPENNRYIQLHEWQVSFCQNNHCAALILAYFIAWHDWKLRNDEYYSRFNDIAEMHGDGRPHNQNAYLYFTMDDLVKACMGICGKQAIRNALAYLESCGVISIHKNPNPRYYFDKTKYFQFYPQVCNQWIQENYPLDGDHRENDTQPVDFKDRPNMEDGIVKSGRPSNESKRSSSKTGRAITDTTNNTTNKNKSINAREDFSDFENEESIDGQIAAMPIIELLIEKGMPADRLKARDDLMLLARLIEQGATAAVVSQAYDASVKATASRGSQFGVRYLAKAVESLLSQEKAPQQSEKTNEFVYENNLKNAESWAGDLI